MALQDRPIQPLTNPQEAEEYLRAHPDCAVFKAGECYRSSAALERALHALAERTELPIARVRVVVARAASDWIAETTGIRHASPQLLLFRGGKVVYARDDFGIDEASIAEALRTHFGEDAVAPARL
jgi:bacillithiol system protein YtxJ